MKKIIAVAMCAFCTLLFCSCGKHSIYDNETYKGGYDDGYDSGYEEGYLEGYDIGYLEAEDDYENMGFVYVPELVFDRLDELSYYTSKYDYCTDQYIIDVTDYYKSHKHRMSDDEQTAFEYLLLYASCCDGIIPSMQHDIVRPGWE